jgi:hypothetical protein
MLNSRTDPHTKGKEPERYFGRDSVLPPLDFPPINYFAARIMTAMIGGVQIEDIPRKAYQLAAKMLEEPKKHLNLPSRDSVS